MNKEIIKSLKLLSSYIEYMDEESVIEYLDNHIDSKMEISHMISELENIVTN